MRIPTIVGIIDRRILINYQAEKEVIEKFLPATSSFFENRNNFPEGSITFDNALLMKDIDHEWRSQTSLKNQCDCV